MELSKEVFIELIEHSSQVATIIDSEHNIVYMNSAGKKLFNYEFTGSTQKCYEVICQSTKPLKHCLNNCNHENNANITVRHNNKNYSVSTKMLKNGYRVDYLTNVSITETVVNELQNLNKKEIQISNEAPLLVEELELKETNEKLIAVLNKINDTEFKYEKLFNLTRDGYVINKGSGEILEANPAFLRMLGYKSEEEIDWKKITPEKWLKWEIETHGKMLVERGYTDLYEKEYQRNDGTIFPIQIQAFLLNKPANLDDALIAAFVRDITQLKENEEIIKQKNIELEALNKKIKSANKQLLLANNKLESNALILNKAGEMVMLGGWEINLQENMLNWTNEVYRIHEVDDDFVPNVKTAIDFYHEESKLLISKAVEEAIQFGKPFDLHLKIITAKNNIKDVWAIGQVKRDSNNNPVSILGTIQDITMQKLHEKELMEARAEAEHANKLKSAFLANMSHEIRTPLNGIIGFTDFLVNANNKTAEQRKGYAKIIKNSSDNLLRIVNDIIDMAKLDSHTLPVKNQTFKPYDINAELEQIFNKKLSDLNKQLKIKLSDNNKQLVLLADKTRYRQIISNLIDNAVKFSDKGIVEFGAHGIDNSLAYFYVKDEGIGIPEKNHQLIFERFAQSELSPNRVYSGAGLGLSIVKELLQLMGGEIWLESIPHKGTTFYFSLPLNNLVRTKGKSDVNIKQPVLQLNNHKVLIVEDDKANVMLLEEFMLELGASFTVCNNGNEVMESLSKQSFDLILMDVKLPGVSGLELTKQIRKNNIQTPILAQTAYAMDVDEDEAKEAGCDDFITKPINRNLFYEKIKSLIKTK